MRAGQRGRRVLLLDHADKVGKKILISGGGRCNFTNLGAGPRRSSRPTRISASRRWRATPSTTSSRWSTSTASPGTRRRWASCSATARRGRSWPCCWPNARRPASTCGWRIASPAIEKADRFRVRHRPGRLRPPASLVLATGGLSIPKMGATGFAHDIARRFGLRLTETRPALVPLTLEGAASSAGVSLRGRGALRQGRLPRGHAVHPSRPVGPGDPADLVLLAAGQEIVDRPAARHSMRQQFLKERKRTRAQGRAAHGAGRGAAAAAGAKPGADGTMADLRDRELETLATRLKAGDRARPAPRATPRPR